MKTLLLLAGRSKRFWPLTEKSLWPFLGRPLLAHQVERLKKGGLSPLRPSGSAGEADITFVGGQHNLEQVYGLFPNIPSIEQENLSLGMRGALLSALREMKGPVCIVSGNDVVEPEAYSELLKAASKPGVDGAILAQRVKGYFPGGYIVTSGVSAAATEGRSDFARVAGIVEKPGEGKEPSDLVNIVAHVHHHPEKLLSALEDVSSDRDDAYEVALTKLCKELNYVAVPSEGRWNAIKYPWDVLSLTERFLKDQEVLGVRFQASDKVEVHPTAVIEGAVMLEEGVRVMPHATIQGPCFIGKGSMIGTNTLVRDSIIGEGCVIGFGSEIVRSNLHSYVWTHTTYLGDSVIGRNVAFGAGSVTANFRLDEGEISSVIQGERMNTKRSKLGAIIGSDVRSGIAVSFAPGVKVGAGTFLNSTVFVEQDILEKKYVKVVEGSLEVRENRVSSPGKRS